MTLLSTTLDAIRPVDEAARAAAVERQLQLTKPPTALGRLETIGNQLAAIAGACPPPLPERPRLVVFGGDHGVCAQGVSPWPQEVSQQMAANLAGGGAAASVLARRFGVDMEVVDVGLLAPLPAESGVRDARVRPGTADLTQGPAMTRDEAAAAIEAGIAAAHAAADAGCGLLLGGEIGIGNTTPAAALIHALTGAPATQVTGRGAGAADDMLARKTSLVEAAVVRHGAGPADALGALAAVGGLEHAALAGLILGAASRRLPFVVDGAIACSAALVAVGLCPVAAGYLIAGHRGAEPGIGVALDALGLEPVIDLDLRLGEGTGALLAVPLVQASAAILRDMATFASAAVSGRAD